MSKVEADTIPFAGDLLRIYSFNSGGAKKATPLMMEFKVNPETSPFLISSAKAGLLWVNSYDGKVRSAFRPIDPQKFFVEVVEEVYTTGQKSEWGNVHPLTTAGLTAAIAHILSYDLPSPEILANPNSQFAFAKQTFLGCHVQWVDWLDPKTVVVVPQDRDFVGFVLQNGDTGLSVVHNASRSIAVCRDMG